MAQPVLTIILWVAFSALAWRQGNELIDCIWKYIASNRPDGEKELPKKEINDWSPLVKEVGGIERIIYIAGVMSHHYELIGGWLVLKAFFGFLDASHVRRRATHSEKLTEPNGEKNEPTEPREEIKMSPDEIIMARYNGMLIGNALSLLIGLAAGAAAIFIFRILSPADKIEPQLTAWLTFLVARHSVAFSIGFPLVCLLSAFLPIKRILHRATMIVLSAHREK